MMKTLKLITITLILLLIPSLLLAQGKNKTAGRGNSGKAKNERTINKKGYDRFIDKNNDGICDGRGKGLGFKFNNTGSKADSINRQYKRKEK